MAKNGYIRLERKLFDSDLWTAEPFTVGQAWVDLIAMANYAAHDHFYRGTVQRLKRGQFATSYDTLAKRWKWSKGRVARYIRNLERCEMVHADGYAYGTVLTIKNYAVYQDARYANRYTDDTQTERSRNADGTQTERRQTTTEPINKGNTNNQGKESTADAVAVPASAGDVATFVLDNNLDVDPDAFWNYYEANGWVTKAGTPVRNWKALCRTWHGKPQYNTTKTDAPTDPDGLTPEMRASVERVKERRRNEHR